MESRIFFFFVFMAMKACHGGVLFSSLPQTLLVSTSSKQGQGQVYRAGEDSITVTWRLNKANESSYKRVKALLCYAPLSQVDRPWRKTVDNLSKDKTCQFTISSWSSVANGSVDWMITDDIPGATYFIRAYAFDDSKEVVAYGQTSKTVNLFEIEGITGIHWRLRVLSICGSVFPLVSLFGLILREKSKRNRVSKS